MPKGVVLFDDVERTSNESKRLELYRFIVTNHGYSKNAKSYGIKNNIILTNENTLLQQLNFYIDKELNLKENYILYDLLYNDW